MARHKHKPKRKQVRKAKVGKVLHEFKAGTLRSSAGAKVTKRKQAVAIALSEAGLSRKTKKKTTTGSRHKAMPPKRRSRT